MVVFKHILVPIDFGASSAYALGLAIDIAKEHHAALTLVHTWEIPTYAGAGYGTMNDVAPIEDIARTMLAEAVAGAAKQIPGTTGTLRLGAPWREILATIEERKIDLVVMGTHDRQGIGRVVMGSVAEKTVRHSPVSVLVAREPSKG